MISIMIVDDHPMVREGLAAMLESERDFSVSALAATGEEAVAIGGMSKPDIVLSDIRMPGIDGFGVLAKLKAQHPDINAKPKENEAAAEEKTAEEKKEIVKELTHAEIEIDGDKLSEFYLPPNSDAELEKFIENYGVEMEDDYAEDDIDYSIYLESLTEESGGGNE